MENPFGAIQGLKPLKVGECVDINQKMMFDGEGVNMPMTACRASEHKMTLKSQVDGRTISYEMEVKPPRPMREGE